MRAPPALRAAAIAAVLLTGCSQRQGGSDAPVAARQEPRSAGQPAAQLAYNYSYRFRLPSDVLVTAQKQHIAMCAQLGPDRCRMLSTHGGAGGARTGGSTRLEVAISIAQRFGDALSGPVRQLGGTLVSSDVTAEDLARQIVDFDARVRAKQVLADRLNQALATRAGTTADMVATEKAVAEVQEQLDAARAALAQARARIATSPIDITYDGAPTLAGETGAAAGSIGEVFAYSVAALIYTLAAAMPWVLVFAVTVFAIRRLKQWLRKRRLRRQPS